MPKGTRVHRCFTKNRRRGMSKGKAARICQASTGQALKTGKPTRRKKKPGRKT